MLVADPGHDRAQEPRAAVEVAAEPAGPHAGAEELVQQVAVARFDVDKLETSLFSQARRGDVGVDQPLQVVVGPNDGIVVRTLLDPKAQPFLNDHRIDGIPVLPGVMGMEAFAEAARLLAPEYTVVAVEDVDFAAPLKFFRDEPREVIVQAVVAPAGDNLLARCRLLAERMLPGQARPQRTIHFTSTVRLARTGPKAEKAKPAGPANGARLDAGQVYAFYFHGPAYRVVASAWKTEDAAAALLADPLPENHRPAELPLATASVEVGHGLDLVLHWDTVTDTGTSVDYLQFDPNGLHEVQSLPLGESLNHEQAVQLIRGLLR